MCREGEVKEGFAGDYFQLCLFKCHFKKSPSRSVDSAMHKNLPDVVNLLFNLGICMPECLLITFNGTIITTARTIVQHVACLTANSSSDCHQ